MITKKSFIASIEIVGDFIQVKMHLAIIEGDEELSVKYHRTGFQVGTDIDAQFELVNSHIAELGYPAIDESDILKLKNIVSAL